MSFLTKEQISSLKNAKSAIRALDHPLRQSILAFIKKSSDHVIVGTIYKTLKIEQSVASQHLAIMRKHQLVIAKKEGQVVWYSVNDAAIKALLDKCAAL